MDLNRINILLYNMNNILHNPNARIPQLFCTNISRIKNDMIEISYDIKKDFPFFREKLFLLKDNLLCIHNNINYLVWGEIIAILQALLNLGKTNNYDIWGLIHPRIKSVSKKLFEDGHYANAAEDAFVEINDRVKKLFRIVNPNQKVPDGHTAMNTVFSDNNPLVEFCDRSTETGSNIQKGYMQMLAGAMSALRNPKAHANITISEDDAMRRLIFASMLMYKIDEAVEYSGIQER